MKPSERIKQIAAELLREEVKEKNPNLDWERMKDKERLEFEVNGLGYFMRAIIQYLDEKSL